MATRSKAFGSKGPRASHLVKPGGGLKGEVWDFRNDVEESFSSLEGRVAADSYPELDYIDGAGPAAAGGDMVLVGRDLIQGQTFAELTLGTGTSELVITALTPGEAGNDFTVEIVGGGTAGSEAVTKTANAFEIEVEVGVSTADQIATAINANGADSDGYLRCNGGGSGVATAVVTAATALTGGAGEGWACVVGGNDCLPANTTGANGAAALTETSCTVTVPALTPIVATDKAKVYLTTDGVRTDLGSVAVE